MNKKKWITISLITAFAIIILTGVVVLAYKNLSKPGSQESVLNPTTTISSSLPSKIQKNTAVKDVTTPLSTPSSTTAVNVETDQPIDIDKFSKLINNSYKSAIKESLVQDLKDTINEYAVSSYRITSFSVADVNNDNENELLITYAYPYDNSIKEWEYRLDITKKYEEQNIFLCVYGFNSGRLNMYDRTSIPVISTVAVTNLVPDEKKEIFIMDSHMDEYPLYSMYLFENNKLEIVDLESIGLNPNAQFVSVNYDTIYMGSRISGGVYGGDTLKWVDGEFISIEDYYSDNRLLYKTQMRESYSGDISNLHKFDKNIPELENGEVTVENPYQLVSLIGPNRTIYLKPGIYDLGYASSVQNPYVRTHSENSGYLEFSIVNVENLSIIGLGNERVEIALLDAFSSVLKVSGSNNISFENIMMGHGVETFGCVAEVLNIEDSRGINIKNCSFYGCGSHGIITNNAVQMNVSNSVIEECSFGGVIINQSTDLKFSNTTFREISGDIMIEVNNSQNILFDGVKDLENDYDIFEKHENSTLEINNVEKN